MLSRDLSVPRSGWSLVSMYDFLEFSPESRADHQDDEDDLPLCQWCGVERIRYIHVLDHPEYSGQIEVGCICASRIQGIPKKEVQRRERPLRNRSKSRANFPGHANWTRKKDGKGFRLKHQHRIYVMTESRYGSWAGSYMRTVDGVEKWTRVDGWHRDLDAGKLALFDAAHPLDT